MELRKLSLCFVVVLLAVPSQCEDYDYYEADEIIGTIQTKNKHYNAVIGHNLQLECNVLPKEGLIVEWYKDGERIFSSKINLKNLQRYSIARTSADLLISDIQESDSGEYKCQILQETPVSVEHTVSVTRAPKIISFTASDDGKLAEGNDLLLTCNVTGLPKPDIVWSLTQNGEYRMLTEKDGAFSNNSFLARNVSEKMSGRYICYAINSVGHTSANVTVIIFGKPKVHVHRAKINSDIGLETVLQCEVRNEDPIFGFSWYKDGKIIYKFLTEYTITINGSYSNVTVIPKSDDDFGTFTCEVENRQGIDSKSINLVQRPLVENFNVDGPILTWKIISHQPLKQIELQLRSLNRDGEWRTIQVPLPNSVNENKHEYNIIYELNGIGDDTYEAKVRVRNNKSWSFHDEPRIVSFVYRGHRISSGQHARSTAILSMTVINLLLRMLK